MATDRAVKGIVVEPVRFLATKIGVAGAALDASAREKAGAGALEAGDFKGADSTEVDKIGGKGGRRDLLRRQVAADDQRFQADEEGIPGKGRKGTIRRVAVAGRSEGEDLPNLLVASLEKIDEFFGNRTEIADPVRPGQGGRMEEDAAGAFGQQCHLRS